MTWNLELEGSDEFSFTTLLPSTLRDVWDDSPSSNRPSKVPCPSETFYSIQFHRLRTQICLSQNEFDSGDWVIVDADRGFNIGQIVSQARKPGGRDLQNTKSVLRKATQSEIEAFSAKEEREKIAIPFCQEQAREFSLPMEITAAEYQFDGKKLTLYYTAERYIDFRDLVRTLFRTFGIRIWRVWCDRRND
jgi:cell fate regulator YaaT (PSP1 superfamily)